MPWRFAGVLLSTSLSLCLIAFLFWQQDWQYSRPTPRPEGLRQPAVGAKVLLSPLLKTATATTDPRPLFLHFFSPSCPCSRFNLSHVQSLLRQYGSQLRFVAVLQPDSPNQSGSEIQSAFQSLGLPMDSVVDAGGEIAQQVGVYSTPQALLLTRQQSIFFRGNYNASRFCTTRETEFARLAIESLLSGKAPALLPASASIAYGCPLKKPAPPPKRKGPHDAKHSYPSLSFP